MSREIRITNSIDQYRKVPVENVSTLGQSIPHGLGQATRMHTSGVAAPNCLGFRQHQWRLSKVMRGLGCEFSKTQARSKRDEISVYGYQMENRENVGPVILNMGNSIPNAVADIWIWAARRLGSSA
jgi:hypothetical protein